MFILVNSVIMFLFNSYTCLSADDWGYTFIWGTQEPIQSLGDIIKSQYHHYMELNGRFIVHFLVQLFDGILGKTIFNVFNALIFSLFVCEIAMVTSEEKRHFLKIVSVSFFLLFFFFPAFKHVFLWLSGSFNYLWVGTGILFFHFILLKDSVSKKALFPLFILGVICGWSNEAVVIGIGASYFFYFIMHRDRLRGHRKYLLLGFYLGALLLVCSPGSINRAINSSGMASSPIWVSLFNMRNMRLFFLLLFVLVIKLIFKRVRFKEWVKNEQILIMATVFSFIFVVFIGIDVPRSRFGIELFSLLLILRMINWDKVNNSLVACLNVAALFASCYILFYCSHCYQENVNELSQINRNNQVILTAVSSNDNQFLRRYTLDYAFKSVILGERDDKFYGEYEGISKYYGYRHIYFVPKDFYYNLKKNPQICDTIYTNKYLPFYALKSADVSVHNATIYYYDEESQLSSVKRFLSRIIGRVYRETVEVQTVVIEGENYALIPKLCPSQDDQVKRIILR